MNVHGLLYSGISGLVNRSRQEMLKSLERLTVMLQSRTGHYARLNPAPVPLELSEKIREFHGPRFFSWMDDVEGNPLLLSRFSAYRQKILAAADAYCHGQFDLLGYRRLSFGEPIDWHLDPVSGKRAPFLHWSRIDPLNAEVVGDSKVIWELNRHQWLVELGQAYRLTLDERYGIAAFAYLNHWFRCNPPGIGINWASSLEVSFRLIAWCWALFLFKDSASFGPGRHAELMAWIRSHALHVERYMSHHYSPNTHLTGEALGLFYAGVMFSGLPGAARWQRLGKRVLLEQIDRQVLADGVHFEQASCYHRYTIEIYLQFMVLAWRNGVALPADVRRRVQSMLDYMLAILRPDGSLPQLGDADGGWALPMFRRNPNDVRGVFGVAAAWFARPDYAWAAAGLQPETYWLLGQKGCEEFEKLDAMPPDECQCQVFPSGGRVVMRSDWHEHAHQLLVDVGPLGCPVSSGHGHADLLSIECTVFGKPMIVDSGTYCYTKYDGWRNYFRSSLAHSTLTVDDVSQATPDGPFSWVQRPGARIRGYSTTDTVELLDAEHEAYKRLTDPVTHRRRILFVKKRYWLLVDDIYGKAEHTLDLRFQFAPEISVSVDADGNWVRAREPDGGGLLLRTFARTKLDAQVYAGSLHPRAGWVSSDYGRMEPAALLRYSASTSLPFRIVTLMVPVETTVFTPNVTVTAFEDDALYLALKNETVVIDGNMLEVKSFTEGAQTCAV
jgi:uncharacterized heparinase superfamily protein